jgi:dihydrolipoamide dehydrogenase
VAYAQRQKLAADKAGVSVTDRGFNNVDIPMRTNVPLIFAIGDIMGQPILAHKVMGQPMLAHKAVHGAHVASEVIAGELQGNKELAESSEGHSGLINAARQAAFPLRGR